MKKYLIGSMAVIMAIAASAFTVAKNAGTYTFFRSSGSGSSTTKSDYIYDPDGSCNSGTQNCRAQWTQSNAPNSGEHPASDATLVSGSVEQGVYVSGD